MVPPPYFLILRPQERNADLVANPRNTGTAPQCHRVNVNLNINIFFYKYRRHWSAGAKVFRFVTVYGACRVELFEKMSCIKVKGVIAIVAFEDSEIDGKRNGPS